MRLPLEIGVKGTAFPVGRCRTTENKSILNQCDPGVHTLPGTFCFMERIAARNNRWQRWENCSIGRMGIALERWWVRNEPEVNPEDAKGDGVQRPKEEA
jgi:hypothetical protein